jgi:hypothetical protein
MDQMNDVVEGLVSEELKNAFKASTHPIHSMREIDLLVYKFFLSNYDV